MIRHIELDQQDVNPGRALRAQFAKFWAEAQGTPREIYDQFIAANSPIVEGTSFRDSDLDGVPGIWVEPAGAQTGRAVLYIHGGGFTVGSAKAYRGFGSQLASRVKAAVFLLDYPLSPETKLPVALDLAIAALSQMVGRYPSLGVSGDSAGGNLTLTTIAAAKRAGIPIAAAAAFSPLTDMTMSNASIRDMGISDPLIAPDYVRSCIEGYLGTAATDDPRGSPMASIMPGLPPTLVQVGSDEVLRDDSHRYAEESAAAGNTVEMEEYQGMHHVFQLNVVELATSRAALDRAGSFLSQHLA
jgi:epsilon-lactone hydrolase